MKEDKYIKEHKQHTFDSFCKKILKNEAIDIERKNKHLRKFQISFSEISIDQLNKLFYTDLYGSDFYNCKIMGYDIDISDEILADEIRKLPELRREIVLLSYFIGYNDREIAQIIDIEQHTVWYQRTTGLKELKRRLEVRQYE